MKGYTDIREHIAELEKRGLLVRVKREINKDTEMHPLVRWQYRGGIPEKERKAFLFENVVDNRGKKYDIPVGVGVHSASRYIYSVGLGCEPEPEEIISKWEYALAHPIDPVMVSKGPVQEVVYTGEELKKEGKGLDMFPVPISTPGFDNAPYFTCANWTTRDPETRLLNVGNYRAQIKARDKLGVCFGALGQDGLFHWRKCIDRGIPLEAAVVVGAPLVVAYAAVEKIPRGVQEFSVAGGLAGEPIRLVKCKTVDIDVPAEAEVVLEGLISTEWVEPEGPFGESHGHMNPRQLNPFFEIKAITHRKNPIWTSWLSQLTPSESSAIKKVAYEALFYRYLKHERRVKSVTRVVMHEALTNLRKVIIIQMKDPTEEEIWRGLQSAIVRDPGVGKIVIAVDEDIDPEDLDAVFWAMSYRMKPHKDMLIVPGRTRGHGPPFPELSTFGVPPDADDSALLMNAILKEPFPPVSLPKREYMERAKEIWEELGLPQLTPKSPWFGYSLGHWSDEYEEEAKLALEGKHYLTGEKLASRKVRAEEVKGGA